MKCSVQIQRIIPINDIVCWTKTIFTKHFKFCFITAVGEYEDHLIFHLSCFIFRFLEILHRRQGAIYFFDTVESCFGQFYKLFSF